MTQKAKILELHEIRALSRNLDIVSQIERGFVAYSAGDVVVPPVGELLFPDVSGEAHIKYGAIRGDTAFVVKVATGFYNNVKRGLPSFGGCMLLFSQTTGQLLAVLLDEGELTNLRTAAAGAVAAKHLAPSSVKRIGICGTGTQARMQAEYLRSVTTCREVLVWGRNAERVVSVARDITELGFRVDITTDSRDIGQTCNLIVTTTAADRPYLFSKDVRPGTHITAMGSDTPLKAELDPHLVQLADLLVVDSLSQSRTRGEVYHAIHQCQLEAEHIVELGTLIAHPEMGRLNDQQISIADLTGVAVQDLVVAASIYEKSSAL